MSVSFNNSETDLRGISENYMIGNAKNFRGSNSQEPNIAFLANIHSLEFKDSTNYTEINVPGSTGGSTFTIAIGGKTVAGTYNWGLGNFLYNITSQAYTTNITFTNDCPSAVDANFIYTSDSFAVAYSDSQIIVYNISSNSSALIKYPNNFDIVSNSAVGISSNVIAGNFWGKQNTNADSIETNGAFFYNAGTETYTELPSINGNIPMALAISRDEILGSWSEWDSLEGKNQFYLFQYNTASSSYIQTNIPPVLNSDGSPAVVNSFEGSRMVGMINNNGQKKAYIYNIWQQLSNSNPLVISSYDNSSATGISGDYVIGGYYSATPIIAPSSSPTTGAAPVISSGGGGGSVPKKKSAKKSSFKKPIAKKKSSKKRK